MANIGEDCRIEDTTQSVTESRRSLYVSEANFLAYCKTDALYPAYMPVEKRYLWLRTYRDFGLESIPFTNLVKSLSLSNQLHDKAIAGTASDRWFNQTALSIEPPSKAALKDLQERITLKKSLWLPKIVGDHGEAYVRQVLHEAKKRGAKFGSLPRREKLGEIAIAPKIEADLVTTLTTKSGREIRLLFEIKNRLKEYQARDDDDHPLCELLSKANDYDFQPIFICSYASVEARSLWKKIGLVYYVLERQILPSKWKAQIEEQNLIPYDLMNFCEFVYYHQPIRESRMNKAINHDIKAFLNTSWIEKANFTWERLRCSGRICEVISLLKSQNAVDSINALLAGKALCVT